MMMRGWGAADTAGQADWREIASFAATHFLPGVEGWLVETTHPAGEWLEPPTQFLSIAWLTSEPIRARIDLGAGEFSRWIQTNDVIVAPPGVPTSMTSPSSYACRIFAFPYQALRGTLGQNRDLLPSNGNFGSLHAGALTDNGLKRLLNELWDEMARGAPRGLIWAQGMTLQVLARLVSLEQARDVRPKRGGLAPWQERRCKEYMAQRIAEDVRLDDLASLVSMSPYHFARMFKMSFGMPPHRYLVALRLREAQRMLVETDASVTDIALSIGYESTQSLSRLFKLELGITPTRFRQQAENRLEVGGGPSLQLGMKNTIT